MSTLQASIDISFYYYILEDSIEPLFTVSISITITSMNAAPIGWRADGGYQSPSTLAPAPRLIFQYPAPQYPVVYGPPPRVICLPPVDPPPPPRRPVIEILPPPPGSIYPGPTSYPGPPPLPPSAYRLRDAAPELPNGFNYNFYEKQVLLHIMSHSTAIWKPKYHTPDLNPKFQVWETATNFTVKDVIENVRAKGGNRDKCKGWACTEVIERGDSMWDKGSTIEYSSDKAKATLEKMGWSDKRGTSLPPVWLVIHKVEEKKDKD